jgi:hypothetical protein
MRSSLPRQDAMVRSRKTLSKRGAEPQGNRTDNESDAPDSRITPDLSPRVFLSALDGTSNPVNRGISTQEEPRHGELRRGASQD